ncbi:MAG: adenylate/guanylate cyclase domain-containing protein [Rhodospirillales bacterium]|nr:adenylate/guanylate cyclase domain-containing protein [Rhodospirillales bacterium]
MIQPPPTQSLLFDGLAVWLQRQGLHEVEITDVVQNFGRRLVAGGISLHRVSVGGIMLHPVFGALDIVWDAQHDTVRQQLMPRHEATTQEFRNNPFYHMAANDIPFLRCRLDQGKLEHEFPIFDSFRADGVTDYFGFFHSYGRTGEVLWADLPPGLEGVLGSFATRRLDGFSDEEIAYLEALSTPLALTVKSTTTYGLAKALLETFLGKLSGGHVLDGLVERGDGRMINCVLWYCDLRSSTAMAEIMPLDEYLTMLNDYFECTASTVLDHGGEVLKFIGDAVMAIFPIEGDTRPAIDMSRAAVMTAREALSKGERKNAERREKNLPPIEFGIALHAGEVMYGNVGTARRLDFTVTGPAVNEVTRLESLCKTLDIPVVASAGLNELFPGDMASLGVHAVAGVERGLDTYTLPEYAADTSD